LGLNDKIDGFTKCDLVVEEIKKSIIRGEYKQGSKLPSEAALCERYGVSRVTIRESLKKLNMMGIVSIQQGRGTFVKNIDLGFFMRPMFHLIDFEEVDIDKIYEARLYVENCSVRLAAKNRTDENLTKMELLLDKNKKLVTSGAITEGVQVDTDFHVAIAEASQNTLIKAMVINLEEITHACLRRKGGIRIFMNYSYEQHYNIYKSIKDRNEDEAERWMTLHTCESKVFLNSL